MARDGEIDRLKRVLLGEVRRFCAHDSRQWKGPILQTLDELREHAIPAVFFGGTLRSLIVSRVSAGRQGRPRDVDIVVRGATTEALLERFGAHVARETRFGGLQLQRRAWQFDVWPLENTWALREGAVSAPRFEDLPQTTFFNLEAIAVDVWPAAGRARRIYSGDDQFFRGVLDRTLELNLRENPYPELCVVRALVIATGLDYKLGSGLARFIAVNGVKLAERELEDIQRDHYGVIRAAGVTLARYIESIAEKSDSASKEGLRLPIPRQTSFWPQATGAGRIRLAGCA